MSSRDAILGKLRQAEKPYTDVPAIDDYLPMTPLEDTSLENLKRLFIEKAEALKCFIWQVSDDEAAIQKILELIEDDKQILSWDQNEIPLRSLSEALAGESITVADKSDGSVRVGITGVSAALATTGSLLLMSSAERPRTASLLPDCHIAVLRQDQIIPDLETWVAKQKSQGLEHFRDSVNVAIISGASRTADIGKVLVMGAHGPRDLHIIMLEK